MGGGRGKPNRVTSSHCNAKMENRWNGAWEDPSQAQEAGRRPPPATGYGLGTVTLLRCGFLVTSYPRFFRGTGRTGPGLEWQHRAGAEGTQRGMAPQARLGRRASRGPVPSVAPMLLAQTWPGGETKVRGAFRPGRPLRAARH